VILRLPNPMSAAVWLAFAAPFFLLGAGADRIFGAAVFVLACAVLYSKPSPWEARRPSASALRVFLLLEFLYVVSAVYSAGFNGPQLAAAGRFELFRYAVLGAFVLYLIRHFDERVRGALEWATAAAVYVALLFPAADPRGYAAVLCLCWLLYFSRLRLRFLHAATAVLVVVFSGDPAAWSAAFLVLAAGACLLVYRELVRRRERRAAALSFLLGAALLACPALCRRALGAAPQAPLSVTDSVALQFIRRSPVFGWGPVAASVPGRSQYLFWLLESGALGAGVILAALLLAGYRLLRAAGGDPKRLAGAAAFLGSAALMLASGRFLESDRLFFLTAFLAAGIHETCRAGAAAP
jgi:hypothetical protein